MASRAQMIVVVAIVAFGLIGPISFIAQEAAVNRNATLEPAAPPEPLRETVTLTQVREYTAEVTAEIVEVSPVLVAVVLSDNESLEQELSGIPNATLVQLAPLGGNRHSASFSLPSPGHYLDALQELGELGVTVTDHGLPAEIKLPESFIAYRGASSHTLSVGAGDEVSAIVSGRVLSGPANFTLSITQTGNLKRIVAVEP